ncbi:winged helix-turn-helix domain-containing protein, partial [Campylobacter sp.]|uniref:winged helix-turn-helix domain-containing protein n=1 Tax=Campylobacter sp. TaxID=205 RepID=UPI0026DDCBBE
TYAATTLCEPQLGKRGLYPSAMLYAPPQIANFLAFCDGKRSVLDIAQIIKVQGYELQEIIAQLLHFKLIKELS